MYAAASELVFKGTLGSCFHCAAHWAMTVTQRFANDSPLLIINTHTQTFKVHT